MKTTKTLSITMPLKLLPLLKRRAREERRSVSSYLAWLVDHDHDQTKNILKNVLSTE